MSLTDVIRRVERRERRLTLFDPPSREVARTMERTFGEQGVVVEVCDGDEALAHGHDPSNRGMATVSDGDDVVTSVPLDEPEQATAAVTDALIGLQRTTFSSYDTAQMVATTREIEDRAWRVGSGLLRAGFQTVSALSDQLEVYRQLGTRDLDVHTYAVPSATDDFDIDIDGVTVHLSPTEELSRSWFVVYDGGDDAAHSCALLAEERGNRRFTGFWTVDPALVEEIDRHLERRY